MKLDIVITVRDSDDPESATEMTFEECESEDSKKLPMIGSIVKQHLQMMGHEPS